MKILILSFYFQPDLSAGSFRTTALVRSLKELSPETEIHVVTTQPNRYSSFAARAPEYESSAGVTVTRIPLPGHESGMLDQSKAFMSFATRVMTTTAAEQYDCVFATSSRLMTGALGAWIARKRDVPLYLDIRDIFVDTIKDVLPRRIARLVGPLFTLLERWTILSASKVNLVSGGFSEYFEHRYPRQHFAYFTNGIDDEFIAQAPQLMSRVKNRRPLVVVYAGNLGEGQGMHAILPNLAKLTAGKVHFRIFGDGGRKAELLHALRIVAADNVDVFPPIPRAQLVEEYRNADILLMHLNNHHAFKKVLPSKVFEYAALGKPVWAGIPGFSARFVAREVENAAVFPPCDAEAALEALDKLVIQDRPRAAFVEKYARSTVSRQLAEDILDMLRRRSKA